MASVLPVLCTTVFFIVNIVLSAPPAYVTSTRPAIRLSDQEFEHIIKDEQEKSQKTHQAPPDEKTLVRTRFFKLYLSGVINIKRIPY